jgi:hypothetical protein
MSTGNWAYSRRAMVGMTANDSFDWGGDDVRLLGFVLPKIAPHPSAPGSGKQRPRRRLSRQPCALVHDDKQQCHGKRTAQCVVRVFWTRTTRVTSGTADTPRRRPRVREGCGNWGESRHPYLIHRGARQRPVKQTVDQFQLLSTNAGCLIHRARASEPVKQDRGSVPAFVDQRPLLDPRHHVAQLGADLLDRMRRALGAHRLERGLVDAVLEHPVAREAA